MVPSDLGRSEGLGHAHVGVADDGQVVLKRTQGSEGALVDDLKAATGGLGSEQVPGGGPLVAAGEAVNLLDADEAGRVRLESPSGERAPGGDHRVEEGQRDGGAHALQEGPAGKAFSGDELHRSFSGSVSVCREGPATFI